jgi:hypothetical protein
VSPVRKEAATCPPEISPIRSIGREKGSSRRSCLFSI